MDLYEFLEYWTRALETPNRRTCQQFASQCGCSGYGDDTDDDIYQYKICMRACQSTNDFQDMPSLCYTTRIREEGSMASQMLCAKVGADDEDTENDYYIGPYCNSETNDEIYLGLWKDDQCTQLVNDGNHGMNTYQSLSGSIQDLGFVDPQSMTIPNCLKCQLMNISDDTSKGDLCQEVYPYVSDKCETSELTMLSGGGGGGGGGDDDDEDAHTDECSALDAIVPTLPHRYNNLREANHPPWWITFIVICLALVPFCTCWYLTAPGHPKDSLPDRIQKTINPAGTHPAEAAPYMLADTALAFAGFLA